MDRWNVDALVRSVLLFCMVLFFSVITLSRKILLFVHPRIVPYVWFAIVLLAVMLVFTLPDVFKRSRRMGVKQYWPYALAVFLAIAMPAKALDSGSMKYADINLAQNAAAPSSVTPAPGPSAVAEAQRDVEPVSTPAAEASAEPTTGAAAAPDPPTASPTSTPEEEAPFVEDTAPVPAKSDVVLTDGNFFAKSEDIFANMDSYKGKSIELVGLVYKNSEFADNEFVPARMMMSCCTADLQPYGMLCRYSNAAALKKNQWVKVYGTLDVIKYEGMTMPVINATHVTTKVTKPAQDYIYPQ